MRVQRPWGGTGGQTNTGEGLTLPQSKWRQRTDSEAWVKSDEAREVRSSQVHVTLRNCEGPTWKSKAKWVSECWVGSFALPVTYSRGWPDHTGIRGGLFGNIIQRNAHLNQGQARRLARWIWWTWVLTFGTCRPCQGRVFRSAPGPTVPFTWLLTHYSLPTLGGYLNPN